MLVSLIYPLVIPIMPHSLSSSGNSNAVANAVRKQVIEYLLKKGYNRTEQTLRQESANLDRDGKPIHDRVEDEGTIKYQKAYILFSDWIDSSLDIYKVSPSLKDELYLIISTV